MARRKLRLIGILLALVTLASCGSRVTEAQRQSLVRGRATVVGSASGGGSSHDTGSESAGQVDAGATAGGGDRTNHAAAAGTATQTGQATGGVARTASDVGITPDAIHIGHVTTLSGPVPGLFQGSVVGLQAFIAYQNSKGGIGGRKLVADIRDDQFDASANRAVTRDLIDKTFALVGGISLYDDASAADVQASGIPDITTAISGTRFRIPDNFSPSPIPPGAQLGPLEWLKEKYPDDINAVAGLYADIPAAKTVHVNYHKASETLGYKWVYERAFQATETDFTADVIRIRQSGAKSLVLLAADGKTIARILKAIQQQNFKINVFASASAYDATALAQAGSAAEGLKLFLPNAMYAGEDSGIVPEVKLMNEWVAKVRPGFKPDNSTNVAWSASRLFADAMAKVGPNPKRTELLAALRSIDKFSANGMLAETGPAAKRPAICDIYVEVKDGKYRRIEPATGYRCGSGYWRPA